MHSYIYLVHEGMYCAAQLQADLEKTRDELERTQRKYETEVELRDKQIYQLKALMAHFKKVCIIVHVHTLVHACMHTHTHVYAHTHTHVITCALYRSFQASGHQLSKPKKKLLNR